MASQIELMTYNWNALYFDQRDLAVTKTVWLQYLIVTFYVLSYAPIYISGFLQIFALKYILEDVDGYMRRAIIDTPALVYSSGLIPGVLFSILYWIEVYCRDMKIFMVMGYYIGPNIYSITFIVMVIFAMSLTMFGCYLSYVSFQQLKKNKEKMLAAARKSNVPNFVVFQVLGIGYSLPFVGFLKGLELLIWYYPSPINIYVSVFGMFLLVITPFNTFYLNGTHKNVYPLVPLVSWLLKLNYESVIKKEQEPVKVKKSSSAPTSDRKSTAAILFKPNSQ
ncbi:hypothetical protein HDV06_001250 [Boothiomyces sp. JEL0866]|nr:hypothetical protein HDV06_001250 [Boothiomyces sp. JEL0866]